MANAAAERCGDSLAQAERRLAPADDRPQRGHAEKWTYPAGQARSRPSCMNATPGCARKVPICVTAVPGWRAAAWKLRRRRLARRTAIRSRRWRPRPQPVARLRRDRRRARQGAPATTRRGPRPRARCCRQLVHRIGKAVTGIDAGGGRPRRPTTVPRRNARRGHRVAADGVRDDVGVRGRQGSPPATRRRQARPADAAPTVPLTKRPSPVRAVERRKTRRGRTLPTAVTSTNSGPWVRVMLPPTTATR